MRKMVSTVSTCNLLRRTQSISTSSTRVPGTELPRCSGYRARPACPNPYVQHCANLHSSFQHNYIVYVRGVCPSRYFRLLPQRESFRGYIRNCESTSGAYKPGGPRGCLLCEGHTQCEVGRHVSAHAPDGGFRGRSDGSDDQ